MTDPRTPDTAIPLPLALPFRVSALPNRKVTRFDLAPPREDRAALAQVLGITAVHALRMKGELRPVGRRDFELHARLEAEVEQPCAVTLAPVKTRIDEPVTRRFLADFAFPEGDEVEMPEDDTAEPLPEVIDVGAVAVEALALALPAYPRAPGAELGEAVFAAPGVEALRDEDLRPFSALAALKSRLEGGEGGTGDG